MLLLLQAMLRLPDDQVIITFEHLCQSVEVGRMTLASVHSRSTKDATEYVQATEPLCRCATDSGGGTRMGAAGCYRRDRARMLLFVSQINFGAYHNVRSRGSSPQACPLPARRCTGRSTCWARCRGRSTGRILSVVEQLYEDQTGYKHLKIPAKDSFDVPLPSQPLHAFRTTRTKGGGLSAGVREGDMSTADIGMNTYCEHKPYKCATATTDCACPECTMLCTSH